MVCLATNQGSWVQILPGAPIIKDLQHYFFGCWVIEWGWVIEYGTSPLDLDHLGLAPVNQSGGPGVSVLEKRARFFQTFRVAASLGPQVMFGEALGDLGLRQNPVDEPAPH